MDSLKVCRAGNGVAGRIVGSGHPYLVEKISSR